jgi:hypothetical protein
MIYRVRFIVVCGACVCLLFGGCMVHSAGLSGQKAELIALMQRLPSTGDGITPESGPQLAPYLPALLALTEEDLAEFDNDIYPFIAVLSILFQTPDHREYVVQHFSDIRHPDLQLFVAAALFDMDLASNDIVHFLRLAMENDADKTRLAEIIGPGFKMFESSLSSYELSKGNP